MQGQFFGTITEVCEGVRYVTGIKDAPVKDNEDDGFRSNAREILVGQV